MNLKEFGLKWYRIGANHNHGLNHPEILKKEFEKRWREENE